MGCTSIELTLEGALADPMIAAAMRADRVDPRSFEHLLRKAARDLEGERGARAMPVAWLAGCVRAPLAGAKPRW